jgi:hypothetical protein
MSLKLDVVDVMARQRSAGVTVDGREELSALMPNILDRAFKGEL